MKKLIRRLLSIVIVLVVLAVAGVVAVVLFADKAVKAAVEKAGTRTLNVAVTVDKAKASILSGSVGLQDISVANPPGYQGTALLTLQRVDVQADTGSLLSDKVLIKDMKLDHMEVFVEQKGLQNNLYEVIKPLREPHEPTGKSLIIDNLEITNITVHANVMGVPGQTPKAQFTLDAIRMTEVGRNERVDTAVLIGKILLEVASRIAAQSGGILPKETIGEIGSILDKAIDLGKILLPGGKKTEEQQKGTQDSGKSVTDGIQDILGRKKK